MSDGESQWRNALSGTAKTILFLVVLNVFFVAISLLGAFKDLGHGYGAQLIQELALNPFMGLLLGIVVTSIIQSSSTTTSIVVALVASGAFGSDHGEALTRAIPIIMGANIGTSVTNMLVSMAHIQNRQEFQRAFSVAIVHDFFNVLSVAIFLPLQLATGFLSKASSFLANTFADVGGLELVSPLHVIVKPQVKLVESMFSHGLVVDFMIGFILFVGLFYAVQFVAGKAAAQSLKGWTVPALAGGFSFLIFGGMRIREFIFTPEAATFLFGLTTLILALLGIVMIMRSVVLARVEGLFHGYIFKTTARALALGLVITAIVQSSSVTTSIVVPLAAAGILNIRQIFPYTLGANVGTTVTAILAALSAGEVTGISVAFSHLLFNMFGIAVWLPLSFVPIRMAESFGALASKSKAVPIVFVMGLFIGLPALLIVLFR